MKRNEVLVRSKNVFSILGMTLMLTVFARCDFDDDTDTNAIINQKLVPIVDVRLPDTLVQDSTYTFRIGYTPEETCNVFDGFQFTSDPNVRTIGVVNSVLRNVECEPRTDTIFQNVDFEVRTSERDSIQFRFWRGLDADGNSRFLEITLPKKEN